MTSRPTADDWWIIAAGVTVVYMAAMYWCMPTQKAKQRMVIAPLVGWIYLLPSAMVKGYSASHALYIYSVALAMFIVMFVPVAKRVAADIVEQEEKPWLKVPLNSFAWYWMLGVFTVFAAGMAYLWPFLA
ncbi:hypothetical protein [Streptomyces sp. NPDC002265]|uniref:hypothetical protein n=1 Tax=Streptomyces sp. NPDC002265 TaxID=3154415 RepID=UPI00331A03D6